MRDGEQPRTLCTGQPQRQAHRAAWREARSARAARGRIEMKPRLPIDAPVVLRRQLARQLHLATTSPARTYASSSALARSAAARDVELQGLVERGAADAAAAQSTTTIHVFARPVRVVPGAITIRNRRELRLRLMPTSDALTPSATPWLSEMSKVKLSSDGPNW